MTITEKQIENDIITFLRKKGVFCWKNQSTGLYDPTKRTFRKAMGVNQLNGVSDILGIVNGRMLAIEVKKPYISKKTMRVMERSQEQLEKLASDDQILFIKNITALGGVAFYADSIDLVKIHMREFI